MTRPTSALACVVSPLCEGFINLITNIATRDPRPAKAPATMPDTSPEAVRRNPCRTEGTSAARGRNSPTALTDVATSPTSLLAPISPREL